MISPELHAQIEMWLSLLAGPLLFLIGWWWSRKWSCPRCRTWMDYKTYAMERHQVCPMCGYSRKAPRKETWI